MYIIVRVNDNVIVGTATNAVNIKELSKRGRRVYEIDNSEFNESMLGQKITEYEFIEWFILITLIFLILFIMLTI